MRPVRLIVTVVLALVVAFSWWTSDARAGIPGWRMESGRENAELPSASSGQHLAKGKVARVECELDDPQRDPGLGSRAPILTSQTPILAAVCTGLGLVVIVAVAVSVKQPSANGKASRRRSQREFKARTWVELTESPQF